MIDVVQATLDSLKSLTADQLQELGKQMRYDTKKYVSVVFPDIITKAFSDEKKIAFINGELIINEIFPKHHLKMYEIYDGLIDGDIRNAAMILFREGAKTTLKRMVSTKIISYAIFNVQLFVSETIRQAKNDIDTIKHYIDTNPIIRYLFSEMKGGVWNKEEATFYSQGKELYILAGSVGSKMRGLNHKGNRVGITFCDDFESPENSGTELSRESVTNTIDNDILHIGEGNFEHRLAIQGTTAHPLAYLPKARTDLRFKEPYGIFYECAISDTDSVKYNYINKKYDVAPIESFDVGNPTWPETKPRKYIQYQFDIATQGGGKTMWRILQEWWNVPRQESKALFDTNKIIEFKGKFVSKHGITYIEREIDGKLNKMLVDVYAGVDPASGRGDQCDDTAGVTAARLPNGDFVLLNVKFINEEFDEQKKMCHTILRKYSPRIMRIETIAYQYSLFTTVKKEARLNQCNSIIKDWDHKKNKNNKFKEGLTDLVNTGKLYYITGCEGIEVLKRQLANFNRQEDKDDTGDGLYLMWISAGDRLPKNMNVDALVRTKMIYNDPVERARAELDLIADKKKHWTSQFMGR